MRPAPWRAATLRQPSAPLRTRSDGGNRPGPARTTPWCGVPAARRRIRRSTPRAAALPRCRPMRRSSIRRCPERSQDVRSARRPAPASGPFARGPAALPCRLYRGPECWHGRGPGRTGPSTPASVPRWPRSPQPVPAPQGCQDRPPETPRSLLRPLEIAWWPAAAGCGGPSDRPARDGAASACPPPPGPQRIAVPR